MLEGISYFKVPNSCRIQTRILWISNMLFYRLFRCHQRENMHYLRHFLDTTSITAATKLNSTRNNLERHMTFTKPNRDGSFQLIIIQRKNYGSNQQHRNSTPPHIKKLISATCCSESCQSEETLANTCLSMLCHTQKTIENTCAHPVQKWTGWGFYICLKKLDCNQVDCFHYQLTWTYFSMLISQHKHKLH